MLKKILIILIILSIIPSNIYAWNPFKSKAKPVIFNFYTGTKMKVYRISYNQKGKYYICKNKLSDKDTFIVHCSHIESMIKSNLIKDTIKSVGTTGGVVLGAEALSKFGILALSNPWVATGAVIAGGFVWFFSREEPVKNFCY